MGPQKNTLDSLLDSGLGLTGVTDYTDTIVDLSEVAFSCIKIDDPRSSSSRSKKQRLMRQGKG